MNFFLTIDREGRFGAWMTSAFMLVMAVTMLLPGDSLGFASFQQLRAVVVSETLFCALCLTTGLISVLILLVNGNWYRTPEIRGIMAGARMALFVALGILTILPYVGGETQALGFLPGLCLVCIGADVREAYRAGTDHRHARLLA